MDQNVETILAELVGGARKMNFEKFKIGLVLDGGSYWFGNETTILEQILMRNQ